MWKGLKKVLGHRAKAQKTGPADVSIRSTSSAGQSSHGALFALDMADVDAMLTSEQQQNQQLPAPAAVLTWAQLQQQLQQQHAVQQLMQQTEDSTSKRRAAAMQKRVNNSMLNPSTYTYQIKALLSLSTLFEHKVRTHAVSCTRPALPWAVPGRKPAQMEHGMHMPIHTCFSRSSLPAGCPVWQLLARWVM